jgi:hypothetical protein
MLTERQCELVRSLSARGDDTQAYLGRKAIEGTLSSSEIGMLCELISNEMMMNGIEETFEPTEYGKELELLLDAVNGQRLRRWSSR